MSASPVPSSNRLWLLVAGLAGASAVAIGAFGAHGLETRLLGMGLDPVKVEQRLDQFDTGARYHLAHAIVLLVLALQAGGPSKWRVATRSLFVAGIFFFSGSLYLLVMTNTPWLGAITPIGGASWIVAWLMLSRQQELG